MKGTLPLKLTAVALTLAVWSYAQLPAAASQDVTLSGVVPGPSTQIKPDQTGLDNFAWRAFVALNWPAGAGGGPDLKAVIGQRPGAPRVWESYTDPDDIFYGEACSRPRGGTSAAGGKVLSRIRKRIEKLSGSGDLQAGSNWPLVDQAHNFALYETRLNDTQTNYICSAGLTSPEKIAAFVADKKTVNFPFGSLEVKAAWRLFPPDTPPAVLARYHTREATIASAQEQPTGKAGTGAARTARGGLKGTVGLVGLHITYKIKNQPKWIWATFEQVDNYKVDYRPLPGLKPTFGSGTVPSSPDLYNRQPLGTKPAPDPRPTYVSSPTQPTAADYTTTEVASCPNEIPPSPVNASWQQSLAQVKGVADSPWQYYRLNSVQWFDAGERLRPRNSDGVAVLRNSVLETYLLGDQTIAAQVPAVGLVASDVNPTPPQGTLADTIVATVEAADYPHTNTGSNTWSSCVLCHQMALYGYAVKDCKTQDVMTDYSFVFRSFLPKQTKPSTCGK
jgi:hypothetical protein